MPNRINRQSPVNRSHSFLHSRDMAPPLINATCAALATANYTLISPAIGNITTCLLGPHKHGMESKYIILITFWSVVGFSLLYRWNRWFIRNSLRGKIIDDLRDATPSSQLHEEVERLYAEYHNMKNDPRLNTGRRGRIVSVERSEDVQAGRRTIKIVENTTVKLREAYEKRPSQPTVTPKRKPRVKTVPRHPPPRRQDQIPSLPLAADRTIPRSEWSSSSPIPRRSAPITAPNESPGHIDRLPAADMDVSPPAYYRSMLDVGD